MRTRKTANPKRWLSLLLTAVLLFGMMPLTAPPADAAETAQKSGAASLLAEANAIDESLPDDWNMSPEWELIKDVFFQDTRLYLLRDWLGSNTESTKERYIRLEADIEVSEDYKFDTIEVYGKKVLDLNGHKISIKIGKGEGYSGRKTAIGIHKDATLMIIDSRGGGKIFGDSWICDPVDMNESRASTDLIKNYGTLIVNMPNGELETGRSKKQWVTGAAKRGDYSDSAVARYNGYIRGQSNGTAIISEEGSTTVLVSGRVIGRGFYEYGARSVPTEHDLDRCSAILVKSDCRFIMYDGEVMGLGGANSLRVYSGADPILYAGNFSVRTLDKMAIEAHDPGYTPKPNYTEDCGYGTVFIADQWKAPGYELIYDNNVHDATIRPKSVTDTTSDAIRLTHSYGTNVIDLDTQNRWNVFAYYTPYYSETARKYLGNGGYTGEPYGYDYRLDTNWSARAEFTVLKQASGAYVGSYTGSTWKSDDANQSIFVCDVLACKDKKGNPIAWERNMTYTLRCTVTETFGGDPVQTRTVYQDLNFNFFDTETRNVAKAAEFDFIPRSTPAGEPTNFTVALKESLVNTVRGSDVRKMSVKYSYFAPVTDNKGKVTGYEKKSGGEIASFAYLLDNDGTNYFPNKSVVLRPECAGPLEVTVSIFTYSGLPVDSKTYTIFAMPALTGKFLGDFTVPEDGWTMEARISTWKADLNSGLDAFSTMTAYNIDKNAVIWQYYDTSTNKFVDISRSDSRFDFTSFPILSTNRTGEYRASYQFNGARYYSPRSIYVVATNYESNYKPSIKGPGYADYGDGTKLTVKLNADADWSGVSEYILICRGYPTGARIGNSSVSNTTGVFDVEKSFFGPMNKNTFVPGSYVFEAKVRHANGVATSFLYSLTYNITSTGFVFTVDNERAEYNDEDGSSRYNILSDSDGIIKLGYALYPANASLTQYPESQYNYTIENLSPELLSIAEDGTATILAPGTATVRLNITEKAKPSNKISFPLTLNIPIVGFEVEEPNYNDYLGQKWEDVRAVIKSVWGPGGRKVYANTDQYLTVSPKTLSGVNLGSPVSYNDKADITWTVETKSGYRFAMKFVGGGYSLAGGVDLCADVYTIKTNAFTDTVKSASEYGAREANSSADWYYYVAGEADDTESRNPSNARFYLSSKNAHVKKSNAQYIDVVSITTSTPAVGDLRYEGTDTSRYYDEFMTVEIGTLSGVTDAGGNPIIRARTWVSKLDSLKGSGKPYDNAAGENMGDYYTIGRYVDGVPQKPTETYEAGIYKNMLALYLSEAETGGTSYYFAPEVKLFVNGHLIEYASIFYSTYYPSNGSTLYADYYFDVGEVTQHTTATVDLTDITPIIGQKPKDANTVSVVGNDDLEVTKLLWFVDANGNGKFDLGEEISIENGNLTADGTFMSDKKYSLDVEVGLKEGAVGRIAYPFTLKAKYADLSGNNKQTKEQIIGLLDPCGVFTFPYNYIAQVDEVVSLPADGEYTKYTAIIRHINAEENQAKGYYLSGYGWMTLDGAFASELIPGQQYWYMVNFAPIGDGVRFAPSLVTGTLDGNPLPIADPGTSPRMDVSAKGDGITIYLLYKIPNPATDGVTVSGKVTSYNPNLPTAVTLMQGGEVKYTAAIAAESGSGQVTQDFRVPSVAAGTYDLVITKDAHLTYTVKNVVVGTAPLDLTAAAGKPYAAITLLVGDLDGDGSITEDDVSVIRYSTNMNKTAAEAANRLADIDGDGNVTEEDVSILRYSTNMNKTAENCTYNY